MCDWICLIFDWKSDMYTWRCGNTRYTNPSNTHMHYPVRSSDTHIQYKVRLATLHYVLYVAGMYVLPRKDQQHTHQ